MRECQNCKSCYPDDVKHCPKDGEATFHSLSGDPLLEGKYQLESRLGQGGMGVVYRARHTYLKTAHAIKVILPDLVGNDPQLITRFRQEALAAAAIRHQNVVNVSDYGVVEGKIPFLVMEFVQGQSLHDLLATEKRFSPERAFEVMSAICMGVGAAHRQGIVHRDLKPLNIIIQDDRPLFEAVKILDFGLAKIKSDALLGSFVQAQTTGLMGSPYYMAPEQWSDEDPDAHSDVYSLGVMLFQMLAGDVPFKGGSIPAIMKKHLSDPPPAFASLGLDIPPAVEEVVKHALEKDREKRTQSVEVMVDELRAAVHPPQQMQHQGQNTQSSFAQTVPSGVLPVASLHVVTKPPQSKVFLNNTSVGQTQTDGSLLLEGIQSGNHHLRVSHDGFNDWQENIIIDGRPREVVAELSKPSFNPTVTTRIPQPTMPPLPVEDETVVTGTRQTVEYSPAIAPVVEKQKKKGSKGLLLGGLAVAGVLLVSIFGIGIYWVFFRDGGFPLIANTDQPANRGNVPPANTSSNTGVNNNSNVNNTAPPPELPKAEMVRITGGKFAMGRNNGPLKEQPAHEVDVKDFWMDKTEVTNAEYAKFIADTKYRTPDHWVDGKPLAGQEAMPVVFVSLEDAKAFAAWRSKRDSVEYRLPTEEEWEYAARNGGQYVLFPWGEKWVDGNGVIDQAAAKAVGSAPNGNNKWGVEDLIGNVWEWTSSDLSAYPGSKVEPVKSPKPRAMIRGGAFLSKAEGGTAVNATFRGDIETEKRNEALGFRLVRSQ